MVENHVSIVRAGLNCCGNLFDTFAIFLLVINQPGVIYLEFLDWSNLFKHNHSEPFGGCSTCGVMSSQYIWCTIEYLLKNAKLKFLSDFCMDTEPWIERRRSIKSSESIGNMLPSCGKCTTETV